MLKKLKKVGLSFHLKQAGHVMQELPFREWGLFFQEKYGWPRAAAKKTETRLVFHPKKLGGRSLTLRSRCRDIGVFTDLLAHGMYMPAEELKKPGIIMDLGVNIGCTAAHFAAAFPGARIFGVELEKQNFELAQINTQTDRDRVQLLHGAVWDEDGVVSIRGASTDGYAATADQPGDRTVPAFRVTTLLKMWGISVVDYLKMDIEGAEKNLLLGPSEPRWLRQVSCIQVEVHQAELLAPISSKLKQFGFKVTPSRKHWSALYGIKKYK